MGSHLQRIPDLIQDQVERDQCIALIQLVRDSINPHSGKPHSLTEVSRAAKQPAGWAFHAIFQEGQTSRQAFRTLERYTKKHLTPEMHIMSAAPSTPAQRQGTRLTPEECQDVLARIKRVLRLKNPETGKAFTKRDLALAAGIHGTWVWNVLAKKGASSRANYEALIDLEKRLTADSKATCGVKGPEGVFCALPRGHRALEHSALNPEQFGKKVVWTSAETKRKAVGVAVLKERTTPNGNGQELVTVNFEDTLPPPTTPTTPATWQSLLTIDGKSLEALLEDARGATRLPIICQFLSLATEQMTKMCEELPKAWRKETDDLHIYIETYLTEMGV